MRISDWSSDGCSSDLIHNCAAVLLYTRKKSPPAFARGDHLESCSLPSFVGGIFLIFGMKPLVPAVERQIIKLFEQGMERDIERSEERSEGKEWVSPCRSGW